jgi:hypothetical protein
MREVSYTEREMNPEATGLGGLTIQPWRREDGRPAAGGVVEDAGTGRQGDTK